MRIWAEIIIQLDSYSVTTLDTPVNTVWVELKKKKITSQITTKSLRAGTPSFGKERLGFSHKEVGTHLFVRESQSLFAKGKCACPQ